MELVTSKNRSRLTPDYHRIRFSMRPFPPSSAPPILPSSSFCSSSVVAEKFLSSDCVVMKALFCARRTNAYVLRQISFANKIFHLRLCHFSPRQTARSRARARACVSQRGKVDAREYGVTKRDVRRVTTRMLDACQIVVIIVDEE